MWKSVALLILRFKYFLFTLLLALTGFFAWHAKSVKLGYEFAKAVPVDNPKFLAYERFKKVFGESGGLMVIGVQTPRFFDSAFFNDYVELQKGLKKIRGIEGILSVPSAVQLVRADSAEKLQAGPVFGDGPLSQAALDSSKAVFLNLPFYRGLLYDKEAKTWLMAVTTNNALFNTPARKAVIDSVLQLTDAFEAKQKVDLRMSGLPLIRTVVSEKIKNEMRYFLLGSVALSALILLAFFRSFSAMLLSLAVVGIGVIWSVGFLEMMGYKLSILTALIPPLIIVIGIPNCIYFLNKFHTSFRETGDKRVALVEMISKMGVVTLFCNITAAIGFAVFGLTKSAILKEFGVVAGANVFALFFISLFLIPAVLSLLPAPRAGHMKYLNNLRLQRWLGRLESWSLHHRRVIFTAAALVLAVSIAGMFRLKSLAYVVDDVPKEDKVYQDLKFFEQTFGGVLPLEVVVDAKKQRRIVSLSTFVKMDSLVQYLSARAYMGKALTLTEGLKFAKQAFFEGDSTFYALPGENDLLALKPYLAQNSDSAASADNAQGKGFTRMLSSFMDKDRQRARISVTMKDVGSEALPAILDSVQTRAEELFNRDSVEALSATAETKAEHKGDTLWGKRKYNIELTGGSVTALEGSRFIINGLKESIGWAFLLITACMVYLFRSVRILLCSLIPNLIPLVITAGVMGWTGVPLKPSTVLVFSVALGIAIDITIRFLVNYKQQLSGNGGDVKRTVVETIHSTGLSILYTSIVLTAGFVIFCFSAFGGTKALGWLTSLTLVTATVANLVLLPALLLTIFTKKESLSARR